PLTGVPCTISPIFRRAPPPVSGPGQRYCGAKEPSERLSSSSWRGPSALQQPLRRSHDRRIEPSRALQGEPVTLGCHAGDLVANAGEVSGASIRPVGQVPSGFVYLLNYEFNFVPASCMCFGSEVIRVIFIIVPQMANSVGVRRQRCLEF